MNYNNAVFETSAGTSSGLLPSDLPEVCFSGHSNVGKSSLINKILGRKSLARTSKKPGKTATVNFFRCENVRFVDLPGYGFARVSLEDKKRWSELVEGYFNSDRNIKLVVQLIDGRYKPSKDDTDMLGYLLHNGYNTVAMLTKVDKLNKSEREKSFAAIMSAVGSAAKAIKFISFSAVTGEGNEEIRAYIEEINNLPLEEKP